MTTPHVASKRRANPRLTLPMADVAQEAAVDAAPTRAPYPPQDRMIDPNARSAMIAEAAYYRAAARGFAPGGELQDWLDAEAEIRERLGD